MGSLKFLATSYARAELTLAGLGDVGKWREAAGVQGFKL